MPDLNLLVYAHEEEAPLHDRARPWWEAALGGTETIGIGWAVVVGFVRLTCSRAVFAAPLQPAQSIEIVRSWFQQPAATILVPGPRHLDILETIMGAAGVTGRAATDAHLAALAIENQAELHSNDCGFDRFPGLRWRNPLRRPQGVNEARPRSS